MNDEYKPPLGPRYSQLYLERGEPVVDSKRLRVRISRYFYDFLRSENINFGGAIERRTGAEIKLGVAQVKEFLKECKLRDFLDSVTQIYDSLILEADRFGVPRGEAYRKQARAWRQFITAAFAEENIAYSVDQHCVIHPQIDGEFEAARVSLIRGLEADHLAAVRHEVEKAYGAFDNDPPDTKGAVRAIFEALEIYVKIVSDGDKVSKLDKNAIEHHVAPLVAGRLRNDKVASDSARGLLSALIAWIKPAHIYRHGQKVKDPSPPPVEIAVAFVSSGSAYLRMLLDILED